MNTDRIAAFYDYLAGLIFGKHLHDAAEYFINRIPKDARILIIGGGTGRILRQLDKPGNQMVVDYVELSKAMIEAGRKNHKGQLKVNFIQADVFLWEPQHHYDVIITPFVLDCFTSAKVTELVTSLTNVLQPDGTWIFADFIHTNSYLKKALVRLMYLFFRITTGLRTSALPDYRMAFEKAGLKLHEEKMFYHGMVAARMYQF